MQNNVIELTQKLLKALDSDYNVIDMPQVVEIISVLERVAITKELLEATRLGKYVNELRRKTTDQDLWRRAKELLKKWRSMVLPQANGKIKPAVQPSASSRSAPAMASPPLPGQNLVSSTSPVLPKKVSPPIQPPSPALQNRLVSPGIQRLVSPGVQNRLVSPQTQKRLVSPHTNPTSPGQQSPKVLSPPSKMTIQSGSPQLPQTAEVTSPRLTAGLDADVNLNQLKSKKRPLTDGLDNVNAKRPRLNGSGGDLEFSDSSNSSFRDVILPATAKSEVRREPFLLNSDSNSSFADRLGDSFNDMQSPKKRGRKKGSKNHRSLLDEAETSFTNKLAVSASRGSSKVKTTQEILAGIQSKNSVAALSVAAGLKPSKEDLEEKAAKLTERVTMIDRKLNANNRNKNSQKKMMSTNKSNERVIESGSVINDKSLLARMKQEEDEDDDDEIVVVDDLDTLESLTEESKETEAAEGLQDQEFAGVKSLSEEDALALLPPIDRSILDENHQEPPCTCLLKENKPVSAFSIDEDNETGPNPPFEIVEDPDCLAGRYLEDKYQVDDISEDKICRLSVSKLPNLNGNWSLGTPRPEPQVVDGLYLNVVPNIYESLDKDVRPLDSFKKYSVSKGGPSNDTGNSVIAEAATNVDKTDFSVSENVIKSEIADEQTKLKNSDSESRTEEKEVFREWYECIDKPSYNGDALRILPYCIVD